MSTDSVVPAQLVAAYGAAIYCSDIAPGISLKLRIGRYESGLDVLHDRHHVASSAVITAYNPEGEPTLDWINCAAQQRLKASVTLMGLAACDAFGVDPSGEWQAEPSLLILGISLEQATDLAREYKQNAFVFSDNTAVPSLRLCR